MTDPVAVWSGEFRVSGVVLHCHVLDDGTRIIEAPDLRVLLETWGSGAAPEPDEAGIEAFARWQRGEDQS